MKKILITGANGLLGQKLVALYLENNSASSPDQMIELIATARGENRFPKKGGYAYESMDITDEAQVNFILKKHKPNCVIHTAAMTNVDQCETEQDMCLSLNVEAVKFIVNACNEINAHLIHLSTDFIFDGTEGPYDESGKPNPLSFYGHSKLKAEQYIQSFSKKWAIARTVLVYGVVHDMSRSNIVLWAKGALEKNEKLNVVNDQFRSPTLAEDLAKGCQLIEQKEATGIYNICGKDQLSILELVQRVADYFGLSKENIHPVSSETLNQAAKRPPITGFILEKSRAILGYEPHSFEEGIAIVMKQVSTQK